MTVPGPNSVELDGRFDDYGLDLGSIIDLDERERRRRDPQAVGWLKTTIRSLTCLVASWHWIG